MNTPTSYDPAEVRHAMTFGPDGSYPKAVCGYRGGVKGRMHSCAPKQLRYVDRHGGGIVLLPACPDCLTATAS